MPAATLSPRVDDWLWPTLRTGVPAVANRVYVDDSAPVGVGLPYVQWSLLSSVATLTLGGTRIKDNLVYVVQAIDRSGSWATVVTPADQIRTALHQQRGATADVVIDSCIVEEEVRRPETTDAGVKWRYLGWRVRIEAEST
jgi:hypothetical protein